MGWFYTEGQTRKELIEERTKNWRSCNGLYHNKCLAHCTRGNVLWAVWERYHIESGCTHRYITCDLMQRQRNYGWGYKDMCESMHPYYYSCPLKYLGMAPVASEPWRKGVREYHKRRQALRKAKNSLTKRG